MHDVRDRRFARIRRAAAATRRQLVREGPVARDPPAPDEGSSQIDRGRAALMSARWDEAAKAFAAVAALDATSLDAQLGSELARRRLGAASTTANDTSSADGGSHRCRRFKRWAPVPGSADADTAEWRARSLRLLGCHRAALAVTRQAVWDNPDSAPLHKILGELAADAEFWEDAASAYAQVARLDPQDDDAVRRRTEALRKLYRFNDARAVAAEALDRRPNAALYSELGEIERLSGSLGAADDAFRHSDALDAGNVDAVIGRVRVARQLGKLDDARRLVASALERHPKAVDLLIEAGEIAIRVHAYEQARAYFDAALGSDADASELRYRRRANAEGARSRARRRSGLVPVLLPLSRALERSIMKKRIEYNWPETLRALEEVFADDLRTFGRLREAIESLSWRRARLYVIREVAAVCMALIWLATVLGLAVAIPIYFSPVVALTLPGLLAALVVYVAASMLALYAAIGSGVRNALGVGLVFAGLAIVAMALETHLPVAVGYVAKCTFLLTSASIGAGLAALGPVLGVSRP